MRHSHVILTIRNTHIFSKQPSTQVEKTNSCVAHALYSEKRYSAATPHWFQVLFACFIFSRSSDICEFIRVSLAFFRAYGTHTRPPASQNMTKLNKRGLRKQGKWSEFSPKRQPGLFGSRNDIIIPFTAVANNDRKPNTGHTSMSGVTGHTRLFFNILVA